MPVRRLSAWADKRLLPGSVIILLGVDVGVGVNWLCSPAKLLVSPAYNTGKEIAPMWVHGLIFVVLGIVTAAVLALRWRSWIGGYLFGPLLGAVCAFWALLFVLAPLASHSSSYLGAVVFTGLTALHLLVGAAIPHRPKT